MTLKQLEAFYWGAVSESFAIAAERLHVSVSTLSKRISDLESALGRELFDRDLYRASLTNAGRTLLPQVRHLLDQADALQLAVMPAEQVQGQIRFAVGELASLTWLPRFIAQVRLHYPNLHLEPHVDVGPTMEAGIESGELDFAVISGTSARLRVASHRLGEAHFTWLAQTDLAQRLPPFNSPNWSPLPLITMSQGAGTHRMVEAWVQDCGMFWQSKLTCNTWGSVTSLLLEGVGIGFLPEAWARPLVANGMLSLLPDWPRLPSLYYSLQMRRDDSRPLLHALHKILREVVDFDLPIRFLGVAISSEQPS